MKTREQMLEADKMTDAPERICVEDERPEGGDCHVHNVGNYGGDADVVEYIRADIHDAEVLRLRESEAALRAEVERLREALNLIDALDPEGRIEGFTHSAVVGLVLRMGQLARAALADNDASHE